MDTRTVLGVSLAVTSGVACYSIYQLLKTRRAIIQENVYESKRSLYEYFALHYGKPEEVLRWESGPRDALEFPKRCADLCIEFCEDLEDVPNRAFDIGCAVGRSSFELSRVFEEVVGVDYSHSFVNACNNLKKSGSIPYELLLEGDLTQSAEAVVDPSLHRHRVRFEQGDACDLSPSLGQFACVLAANLICRLHTPKRFLASMSSMVAPAGILVITSPYTFLPEFTPKKNWIGAFEKNGPPFTGLDGLKAELGTDFELLAERDMPFFIRETARKNQWTVAHATVWQRKRK